ncbi:lipase member J-like [Zophobas morio]|uniref:lipase member J-like n=1 Tax=Zophobas morio TaxID=2755281 RepID=UPI003083ACFE
MLQINDKTNTSKPIRQTELNAADYLDIDNNTDCWYNPDVGASPVEEIITRWGYPFETHNFTTEDGYINVLYRIPHDNTDTNITRQPILLHGGLGGGPLTFLYIGNRSLAFFLVDEGFDVWLSNRRGSLNGKVHRDYEKTDEQFWNFTFHECGFYDIKAEINLIADENTSHKKIILLGFSMGSTETYIYAMLRKKHANNHLAGIISISPIAFMTRSGGVIAKLAPFATLIESFLRKGNLHALALTEEGAKEDENFRLSFPKIVFSKSFVEFIVGKDSSQTEAADLPVYFRSKTTPTSIKTLIHFSQEVNAGGHFQYYDYGISKNLNLYKSIHPPSYNLSKIRVPVHLFYGEGDRLSSEQDVLKLYDSLTMKKKSLTCIPEDKSVRFNHADFTLARDIKELLYEVLLKTIREKLSG